MAETNENVIDASVSKSFFVEMLVKDISLPMAIHDLIDNCIDGALRLRENRKKFTDLEVDLRLSKEKFSITDNCGGIDLDTAQNYAFRFGRPKTVKGVSHSIGRFGVGMKRAVFKIGRKFEVISTSKKHKFEVKVDVPSWEETNEWQFNFTKKKERKPDSPSEERGTCINVTDLFESVAERFSLSYFINDLKSSIATRYQSYLESGLVIRVQGVSIPVAPTKFFISDSKDRELSAAFRESEIEGVVVRLIVGVGPPLPNDAGWYVYCNGRMILRADQSEITGWGEAGIERIPKYHNAFARFRGCVYFDSDDSSSLPWNTTKDGVDQESSVYRSVRSEMVTLMKPVLAFLRDLSHEPDRPEGAQPLTTLLDSSQLKPVSKITKKKNVFSYIKPDLKRGPKRVRIQYDRPEEVIQKVKKNLKVRSAKAVGEKTFEYYVKMELSE